MKHIKLMQKIKINGKGKCIRGTQNTTHGVHLDDAFIVDSSNDDVTIEDEKDIEKWHEY